MEARVRKQSFCREDPEACELQILLLLQAKRLPLNVRIVVVGRTPLTGGRRDGFSRSRQSHIGAYVTQSCALGHKRCPRQPTMCTPGRTSTPPSTHNHCGCVLVSEKVHSRKPRGYEGMKNVLVHGGKV